MAFRDLLSFIDLLNLPDKGLDELKQALEQELERARKALDLLNDGVPAIEEKLRDIDSRDLHGISRQRDGSARNIARQSGKCGGLDSRI